jgi:hypothetical protein
MLEIGRVNELLKASQNREQALREALKNITGLFPQFCRDADQWKHYNDARAALAATEVQS